MTEGSPPREIAYRNALMWAFDRLSIAGGMTPNEQRRTMSEIGKVLTGRPSWAATYKPNDWDESERIGHGELTDVGGKDG